MIAILKSEKIEIDDYQKNKDLYFKIKSPVSDVKLASLKSFKLLIEYFSKKNKQKISSENTAIQ